MRDEAGDVYSVTFREDPEHLIEFDVAVTTTGESKTGGGIGIFVGAVALGSKGESAKGSESVSRVRFAVPVVYPTQHDPTVDKKKK